MASHIDIMSSYLNKPKGRSGANRQRSKDRRSEHAKKMKSDKSRVTKSSYLNKPSWGDQTSPKESLDTTM